MKPSEDGIFASFRGQEQETCHSSGSPKESLKQGKCIRSRTKNVKAHGKYTQSLHSRWELPIVLAWQPSYEKVRKVNTAQTDKCLESMLG